MELTQLIFAFIVLILSLKQIVLLTQHITFDTHQTIATSKHQHTSEIIPTVLTISPQWQHTENEQHTSNCEERIETTTVTNGAPSGTCSITQFAELEEQKTGSLPARIFMKLIKYYFIVLLRIPMALFQGPIQDLNNFLKFASKDLWILTQACVEGDWRRAIWIIVLIILHQTVPKELANACILTSSHVGLVQMIRVSSNGNDDALANDDYRRLVSYLAIIAGISMFSLRMCYYVPDLWYVKWAYLISVISWVTVIDIILCYRIDAGIHMGADDLPIYSLRILKYSYALWPLHTSLDRMVRE